MQKITLYNDFHRTSCTLHVRNGKITPSQVHRARSVLCGIKGCTCGDWLGSRANDHRRQHGGYELEQTGPCEGRIVGDCE